MTSQEIRRKFLQYFKSKGHTIVPSSPVVPMDDPTLLFTNAGMNQFKDVFLGNDKRSYTRATSSQKCIRAGGKHNDLENVGHTTRHLTFFEMLGNFSFGDYFKTEAIDFAWEFVKNILEMDTTKIWASVYKEDEEAFDLWQRYLPKERVVKLGEKDNFWAMGETGPCGPCSELLYDRGEKFSNAKTPYDDLSGERFFEFWNLVFMQYSKDENGKLSKLPNQNVDTGTGLERLALLKMNVESVFSTDIFKGLIAETENIAKVKYNDKDKNLAPAFHVIADHIRALAFAIADGAQPSNIDRGYVLRKMLRRAVRYGKKLNFDQPFLSELLPRLNQLMGEDYPELISSKNRIEEILTVEEEMYIRTLHRGGNLMQKIIERSDRQISGEDAFRLKDTYGYPLEEVLLIAKDAHLEVDMKTYYDLETKAKELSKKAHVKHAQTCSENFFKDFAKDHPPCEFIGYDAIKSSAKIIGIIIDEKFVDTIEEGQEGIILLDQTPFYAEMGGQVGDIGIINKDEAVFDVTDCCSPFAGIIAHMGKMKAGSLNLKEKIAAEVDPKRRASICSHHTATHLLHWALCKILGPHIKQAGSVVEPVRLRFDFNHHKALSKDELYEVEDLVNEKIRSDMSIKTYELSFEEAQQNKDIKQFFGDKYTDKVRVIDIDFSKELCGGTHASSLGTIGLFKITKESSIAAGVRRIEAVTGYYAEQFVRQKEKMIDGLCEELKTSEHKLALSIRHLQEENKALQKTIKSLKSEQLNIIKDHLLKQVIKKENCQYLIEKVDVSSSELLPLATLLQEQLHPAIIILGSSSEDKCNLLVKMSKELIETVVSAKDLIGQISPFIDGKGGGKLDQAQAGGKKPQGLAEALNKAKSIIEGLC